MPRYVQPRPPRHRVAFVDGVEQVIVPARRNWFALPFLCVWLTFWTFGGITAMRELTREFQVFLAVWLIAWATGWLFAAASILWQITGRETIQVSNGDLLTELRAGPFRRIRCFRGNEVRNLRAAPQTIMETHQAAFVPILNRMGAIRFDHGARTIGLAGGVDEAEAAMICEWLRARLPRR
jgi:hypothetical protein